jgi:hypothetical protein
MLRTYTLFVKVMPFTVCIKHTKCFRLAEIHEIVPLVTESLVLATSSLKFLIEIETLKHIFRHV